MVEPYETDSNDDGNGNGDGKGKIKGREKQQQKQRQDEEVKLAEQRLSHEEISFVIDIMKEEAPYDLISIKQLFFGMMSAFSKNPIPHNVNSKDSGAGKSYLLNLVSSYFPQKYVIALTGMSDKAIMHRNGVMVIEKKNSDADGGDGSTEGGKEGEGDGDGDDEVVEPIAPILSDLELQIEELKDEIENEKSKTNSDKDKDLIREYKKALRK